MNDPDDEQFPSHYDMRDDLIKELNVEVEDLKQALRYRELTVQSRRATISTMIVACGILMGLSSFGLGIWLAINGATITNFIAPMMIGILIFSFLYASEHAIGRASISQDHVLQAESEVLERLLSKAVQYQDHNRSDVDPNFEKSIRRAEAILKKLQKL